MTYTDFKYPTAAQTEQERDWKRQEQADIDRKLAKRDVELSEKVNKWISRTVTLVVALTLVLLILRFAGTPSLSQ